MISYSRSGGKLQIMHRYFVLISGIFLIGATMVACSAVAASATAIADPALDAPLASAKGEKTAVLAGGCCWGAAAVSATVKGLRDVTSGYSCGTPGSPAYDKVGPGETRPAS